ncbi:immune inhibitor A domain-containing protein [Tumebacillus permanentifrigoris]|uniref:Immune inhibitor A n=1 Tax=Tumebacillus permanentifrigoris TaxID=378543 RepID=A0A316D8Q7_9BACL|nr:immune inhibitor A domain-containing protein [Tumebacillus permanentifrigoris]PWK13356.1 immune inhibitor A [Tumebacillus permanentifrigoris]
MKKKKHVATGVATALVATSLLTGNVTAAPTTAIAQSAPHVQEHNLGDIDMNIVNEDKLIESLIAQGVISADASQQEKEAALKEYVNFKAKTEFDAKESDPIAPAVKAAAAEQQSKFKGFNNGLLNGNGNKNGHYKKQPDPVQETAYTGAVKTKKVLVLSVEFADFAHNKIKSGESDNYYSDYNLQHYEDMIFGANGVKGPHGEDFVSQRQFYLQQSGGTFTVEGKAYGWLKVPRTAAYYGADNPKGGHDNVTPGGSKTFVKDVYAAAKAAGIPLQDYDLEDPHDLDGDGITNESDGLVDNLMLIHSGMGQEAGGGTLGNNAIWSHRSAVFYDPDGLGNGLPGFYDYMVMPEDGATGVFSHEFGHNLGLPDEYDTVYSGTGEAVGYWSIMASGSWAGKIPGTEPTGFSPWAKQFFQATLGGNWTSQANVNWEDISTKGSQFLIDQGNSPTGQNNSQIRVNLPKKKRAILAPLTGAHDFWGGDGDKKDNNMVTTLDLTGKSSASLNFDTWYNIEDQWDFGFVQVSTDNGASWKSLSNAHTRSDVNPSSYPNIIANVPGFTGQSNGWQNETFDLSAYAGQKIQLKLRYATDSGSNYEGFFVDNLKVTADGQTLLNDGGENATDSFTYNGFEKNDGNKLINHYYLLEWRNHAGVDMGLKNIRRGASLLSYDPGLVVWYVDDSYSDNWTGTHPGAGFLGVVDSHLSKDLVWSTGAEASSRYHIADAAFGLAPTSGINLLYPGIQSLVAPSQPGESLFDDSRDFNNAFMPDAGRALTSYGLKVRVNGVAANKSVGAVVLYK